MIDHSYHYSPMISLNFQPISSKTKDGIIPLIKIHNDDQELLKE